MASSSKKKKAGPKFRSEIEEMIYGFGSDVWPPDAETVAIVDSLAQQYMQDITKSAMEVADLRGSRLDKDCFLYVVRKEEFKFNRIQQLLRANEELKQAKTLAECDNAFALATIPAPSSFSSSSSSFEGKNMSGSGESSADQKKRKLPTIGIESTNAKK